MSLLLVDSKNATNEAEESCEDDCDIALLIFYDSTSNTPNFGKVYYQAADNRPSVRACIQNI